ncbi:related to small oligopeptide transporter, OPT family [Rhynchosporium agropyri]|uniref:Related to small oligopeptide transporter, OPT family n=1 Tax=Rhynchosporium agropyri TaxID=914238 RepID=A0A1E1JXW0_9HELO|nr:related to small oligopeptide transporter, OPT family [Rhynchosporium agropyri]
MVRLWGKEKDAGVSSAVDPESSGAEGVHNAEIIQRDLKALKKSAKWDPNLPREAQEAIDDAIRSGDLEKKAVIEHTLLEEDSPYPEVRAAVRNYDEDVPANTARAWIIGLMWCTIGSGVNMLFSLRNPSIYLTPIVTLLLSYPFGVAWTYVMPTKKFRTFGKEWSLNSGPFNVKEHTIIIIMANASFGGSTAYSTDVLLAQEVFYGQKFGWGYQLLLTITCQMLGLGLAGLSRKWLVEPAAMIWPSNLILTTMFETIHTQKTPDALKSGTWKIGRYKFFLIVIVSIFVWEWFPLWIAPFLSAVTFVCWAAPNNVVVNQLFGGQTGLALIPITFDWSIITAFLSSPLIYPFHAIANTMIGVLIFTIITSIGVHYTGAFYSEYLPMSTGGNFDNTGVKYNVSKILTPEFTLDAQRYSEYSPIFLSTTFAMAYGLSFATITAVLVHTYLYDGEEIWAKWKAARGEGADVHQRMMMKYKEAPWWWYAASFVLMFALGLTTCLAYDTHLSWWAFIIALLISVFFYLPIGIITATTNVGIGLNVITEFIIGYMQPGRPLAMMMFKMYGYITVFQGLFFTQDIKLAHYMKVPQRVTFWAQFIATLWSCIVQIAVYNWALGSIDGVCEKGQKDHYTCPGAGVFFTASIIWGAIGPNRIFGSDGVYSALMWFFLVGAIAPVIVYMAARRWPNSSLRYINMPIIFGGTANIPPATPLNYASWGIVGMIFNKFIKDRHRAWWSEYNFVLSAALDSGTILCVLFIFFALQLPGKVTSPEWWGGWDGGWQNNMDWNAGVQKVVNGTFGPSSWK